MILLLKFKREKKIIFFLYYSKKIYINIYMIKYSIAISCVIVCATALGHYEVNEEIKTQIPSDFVYLSKLEPSILQEMRYAG